MMTALVVAPLWSLACWWACWARLRPLTQIQDQTVSFVPKIIAMIAALIIAALALAENV
jgi:flagellar biosynthesis protein FliQ